MGQRSQTAGDSSVSSLKVLVFVTPLGYWGLLGHGESLWGITLGHSSPSSVFSHFGEAFEQIPVDRFSTNWHSTLQVRLERYSGGTPVTFDDIELRLPPLSEFQRKVLETTRRLPYGSKMTYGQLADRAGYPRAARAVGSVMASNRFPIIIPCHRVVGANSGSGGYSAPQGITLKERLLQLESHSENSDL